MPIFASKSKKTASILSTLGAKPFLLAIFFNAFVDLGHKITLQNIIFKVHSGSEQVILVAIINALILLPYILLFIPIGWVTDAYAKPQLMRYSAWLSFLLVISITVFYFLAWFWLAFVMTLLMAVQSAFYSPAKLSYIKTLFGEQRLAKANGWAQTSVIAGILLATVIFSLGFEYLYSSLPFVAGLDKSQLMQDVAVLGFGLIIIAILQLLSIYRIPVIEESDDKTCDQNKDVSQPDEWLDWQSPNSGKQVKVMARILAPPFLLPVCGLALFWAIGQGMLAVFPAFAKSYANISNVAVIQLVMVMSALGIALGAWWVGLLSKRGINLYCVIVGVVLLAIGLWMLSYLRHVELFAVCYFLMGVASAFIIVPFNAYIQQQSHRDSIGSIIAGSNLFQNLAMFAMLLLTIGVALLEWDTLIILRLMALLATLAGSIIAYKVLSLKLS